MKLLLPFAAALIAAALTASAEDSPRPIIDLLAFSNGALVESASTAFGFGWEANWLIDEEPTRGWASPENSKGPYEFVFSLPERSRIDRVAFSAASVEQPDQSPKEVDVLVSDQSASSGFALAANLSLEQALDNQGFALPAPATGRWIKIVVKANHGSARYTELMDVHAYGAQLTTTPAPAVSGTYDSAAYGRFHIAQSGAQLTGCYEHNTGLVQGGVDGPLMRLTWSESGGADDGSRGPVVMVLKRDGKGFQGFWRRAGETGWSDDWKLTKVSDQVGSCPHWKPAGGRSQIADSLAQQGRVRLYGINFDSDSDRLRADAKPTLDQLAAALKAHGEWTVVVEGHTDSSSTPAHNLDLSQRRALAVRAFLASAGIAPDHLGAVGYGQDKPIAPNDTAIGRAQNRRVEVARP